MKPAVLLSSLLVSASAFAGLFGTDVKVPAVSAPAAPAANDAVANATKSVTDLAQVSTKIVEQARSLLSNPQLTDAMKAQLTKLTDGVLDKKDGAAAEALGKIVALKPSEEQMGLVKELRSNLGVLVLGRNFDANDPASGGAVKQAIDAIKSKDTAAITGSLQKLAAQNKFTDAQKEMLGNLLGSYNAKLVGAAESVGKAKDALKGFGL